MKYPLNNVGEVRKVNMSIRIPVEVVDYIKERASKMGTSDQSVYLTAPYVHKPHIFIDQD